MEKPKRLSFQPKVSIEGHKTGHKMEEINSIYFPILYDEGKARIKITTYVCYDCGSIVVDKKILSIETESFILA